MYLPPARFQAGLRRTSEASSEHQIPPLQHNAQVRRQQTNRRYWSQNAFFIVAAVLNFPAKFYLFIYFIRSNIQQKQYNDVWAGLTRLERALTVAYNTMEHKISKTVAQKVGLVKIEDKNIRHCFWNVCRPQYQFYFIYLRTSDII